MVRHTYLIHLIRLVTKVAKEAQMSQMLKPNGTCWADSEAMLDAWLIEADGMLELMEAEAELIEFEAELPRLLPRLFPRLFEAA